jgi:extracellular elastinolytic metalloproteinase
MENKNILGKYRNELYLVIALFALFYTQTLFPQNTSGYIQEFLSKTEMNTAQWEVTSQHLSTASNVTHVYFRQLKDHIPIIGSESGIHIASSGKVVAAHNRFVPNNLISATTHSSITAEAAVVSLARQMNYSLSETLVPIEKKGKKTSKLWMTSGGISERDIKAELVFAKNEEGSYMLAWEINIVEIGYNHWWVFHVDATSGLILKKQDIMNSCFRHEHKDALPETDFNKNLMPLENYKEGETSTVNACSECYEVFAFPLESPYFGERTIVENPADPLASPYGWHDYNGQTGAEYFTTEGNNVRAFEASDNFGYQPNGGASLNFTGYTFDPNFTQNFQHENASITNLFYWTNIIHDITYQYGFDEKSGNFQVNNYNRGGEPGDSVITHGQSLNRVCNGSFSTPEDGESPLQIINLCGNKDGDFDTTLIAHEYGHGLSARLTGGGVVTNCLLHRENPMEGWSDWLATILTIKPEDTGATPRPIATYLLDQGPDGPGVRFYPYSTDMNINPLTYADLPSREGVHRIGAIWGTAIWEMTWGLIDAYGFDPDIYNFTGNVNQDAGNIMAMALVTEGLKFTPCSPGFVDARDGILTATERIYGLDVLCTVWEAFAKRGLGYAASQGSENNQFDGLPSFLTPHAQASFREVFPPFCLENGLYESLSGGVPSGGFYSGPGVTDNGDGLTFNFNARIAGEGVHEIFYRAPPTACSPSTTESNELTVIKDLVAPSVRCLLDQSITNTVGDLYALEDFTESSNIIFSDNCPGALTVTQDPPVGTLLRERDNEITITVTDAAGNSDSCSFQFTVFYVSAAQTKRGFISFSPNPVSNEVTLFNPLERKLMSYQIHDINGRLIRDMRLANSEVENIISVASIASGTYFVTLNLKDEVLVMRLLKR